MGGTLRQAKKPTRQKSGKGKKGYKFGGKQKHGKSRENYFANRRRRLGLAAKV